MNDIETELKALAWDIQNLISNAETNIMRDFPGYPDVHEARRDHRFPAYVQSAATDISKRLNKIIQDMRNK